MENKLIELLNRIQLESNGNNITTVIGLTEKAKKLCYDLKKQIPEIRTHGQYYEDGVLALID